MTPQRLLVALLAAIVIALGIGLFEVATGPATAHCQWCPDLPCWGPRQCGRGCFCMKRGGDVEGVCVGLE